METFILIQPVPPKYSDEPYRLHGSLDSTCHSRLGCPTCALRTLAGRNRKPLASVEVTRDEHPYLWMQRVRVIRFVTSAWARSCINVDLTLIRVAPSATGIPSKCVEHEGAELVTLTERRMQGRAGG
jgi:hypothetical protein